MSVSITVGGLFEFDDRVQAKGDAIFPNEFDFTSWEQDFGGAEFIVPVGQRLSTGELQVLFPTFYSSDEIEILIIDDLSFDESDVIVISNQDYLKVQTLIDDFDGYGWIKNELIQINTAPTQNPATLNWEITDFDRALKGTYRNNYSFTNATEYSITSTPRTFTGLPVRVYSDFQDELLFSGRISEAPEIEGAVLRIKCRSDYNCLDLPISITDTYLKEQVFNFQQIFMFDPDADDNLSFVGEISVLPGLEFYDTSADAQSGFKIGEVDNFKSVMEMYCKLNQCFIVFDPYMGSDGYQLPRYRFTSFNFNSIQLQNIATVSFGDVKELTKYPLFNAGAVVGKYKITYQGNEYNFINPKATAFSNEDELSLELPDSFLRRDGDKYSTVDPVYLAESFFRVFGRSLQVITLPISLRRSRIDFAVGGFYYISDIDEYLSFVSPGITSLVFCYSQTEDETKFFHIVESFLYPIPPVFFGTVSSSVAGFINIPAGEQGINDGSGGLSSRAVPVSGFRYISTGNKIKITNLEYTATTRSILTDVNAVGLTAIITNYGAFPGDWSINDNVMVEYQNESALSGDQLLWNFLT